MQTLRVYSGSISQSSLAWDANLSNVLSSVEEAISRNCHFRPGIEYELCGNSCGVHMLDADFSLRSWSAVADILKSGLTRKLVVEVGTVVSHKHLLYNCLVVLYQNKVQYVRACNKVRPKADHPSNTLLSDWDPKTKPEYLEVPEFISHLNERSRIPIGNYFAKIDGVSVFSFFESELKTDLFLKVVRKHPGLVNLSHSRIFEVASQQRHLTHLSSTYPGQNFILNSLAGIDSPKTVFEGGAFAIAKDCVWQTAESLSLQLNPHAHFDFEKKDKSDSTKFSDGWKAFDFVVASKDGPETHADSLETTAVVYKHPDRHSELLKAMSSYLFYSLLKYKACGFFLPLSGGADSSLTLSTIHFLSTRVINSNSKVKAEFKSAIGKPEFDFHTPESLSKAYAFCCFFPMRFSSKTKEFADKIAARCGVELFHFGIHGVFDQFKATAEECLGVATEFNVENGKPTTESIVLQSLQARTRLVSTYLVAQLVPKKFALKSYLLTLATGNLSEVVTGYYSKYDNSCGDIALLGSLTKSDVWELLMYLSNHLPDFQVLKDIRNLSPSAELMPSIGGTFDQTDEGELGMTYEEVDFLIKSVKMNSLWGKDLVAAFNSKFETTNGAHSVGSFVKRFITNRHKTYSLPPAVHLTPYDCDEQFDLRPSIYSETNLLCKRESI